MNPVILPAYLTAAGMLVNLLWSLFNLVVMARFERRMQKRFPTRIEWTSRDEIREVQIAELQARLDRAGV
jgi:hypothetical protein